MQQLESDLVDIKTIGFTLAYYGLISLLRCEWQPVCKFRVVERNFQAMSCFKSTSYITKICQLFFSHFDDKYSITLFPYFIPGMSYVILLNHFPCMHGLYGKNPTIRRGASDKSKDKA